MFTNEGEFGSIIDYVLKEIKDNTNYKLFNGYFLTNITKNIQFFKTNPKKSTDVIMAQNIELLFSENLDNVGFIDSESISFNFIIPFSINLDSLENFYDFVTLSIKKINRHFNRYAHNGTILTKTDLNNIIYDELIHKEIINSQIVDSASFYSKLILSNNDLFKIGNLYFNKINTLEPNFNNYKSIKINDYTIQYIDLLDLDCLNKLNLNLFYKLYLKIDYKKISNDFNTFTNGLTSAISNSGYILTSAVSSFAEHLTENFTYVCNKKSCLNFKTKNACRLPDNKIDYTEKSKLISPPDYELFANFKINKDILETIPTSFSFIFKNSKVFVIFSSDFDSELDTDFKKMLLFKVKNNDKLIDMVDVGIFNALNSDERKL